MNYSAEKKKKGNGGQREKNKGGSELIRPDREMRGEREEKREESKAAEGR